MNNKMTYNSDFEDSLIFNHDGPMSLMERLGYVKQLVFSRTKLEFRLLWNKIFQKEDEELGWLLNPYRREATMMTSFNKNVEDSYAQGSGSAAGREKITVYNKVKKKSQPEKSFTDSALEIARYMGMGVYMTSTSFPSPFLPVNDCAIMDWHN